MDNLIVKYNELTAEEFVYLWQSVWDDAPSLEQTQLALENTLFRVSVFDGKKIVAMARAIGDKGLCYYIKDVVVHPDYQKQGIDIRGQTEIHPGFVPPLDENGIKWINMRMMTVFSSIMPSRSRSIAIFTIAAPVRLPLRV